MKRRHLRYGELKMQKLTISKSIKILIGTRNKSYVNSIHLVKLGKHWTKIHDDSSWSRQK